jgi:hypothetical protein
MTRPAAPTTADRLAARDATLAAIAAEHLNLDTLADQRSGDDFTEQAVWNLRAALEAAYQAGRATLIP